MDSIYSPSTKNKVFGSDKPQNQTFWSQNLPGYNPLLDNTKINFEVGDNCQFGKIVAINSLFGVKSCMVGNRWYNERDLIPVEINVQIKPVSKVNFVVSLVMSVVSIIK